MSRHRAYTFTTNNYKDDYIDYLKSLDKKYLIVGKEIAPTTGTKHLQGYIYWNNGKTFKATSKILHGSRIAIAKGTAQENQIYCKKEGDWYEEGTCPDQGKRNDLEHIKNCIKEGQNMRTMIENNTIRNYQQLRTSECLMKYLEPKRTWKPEIKWYWGASGTGKTKTAFEECKDPYVSGRDLKWWEGYDAHEEIIIDDFRADFCKFHELIRILDRYEFRNECKGASRQLLCKKIIITSCYHPEQAYKTREDIWQLVRRIDEIRRFE